MIQTYHKSCNQSHDWWRPLFTVPCPMPTESGLKLLKRWRVLCPSVQAPQSWYFSYLRNPRNPTTKIPIWAPRLGRVSSVGRARDWSGCRGSDARSLLVWSMSVKYDRLRQKSWSPRSASVLQHVKLSDVSLGTRPPK